MAEDPAHGRQALLTSPRNRIEQAKQMICRGPGQGDRVRPAGRFRAPGRPGVGRRSGRATSSSTSARPPASCSPDTVSRVHRAHRKRPAAGRGLPQRRVRHVRGPAVRGGHAEVRRPVEADEGRRAQGLHRRRRRRHGAGEVRPARLGHLRLHGRRHGAQRLGQRAGALPGGAGDGGEGGSRASIAATAAMSPIVVPGGCRGR